MLSLRNLCFVSIISCLLLNNNPIISPVFSFVMNDITSIDPIFTKNEQHQKCDNYYHSSIPVREILRTQIITNTFSIKELIPCLPFLQQDLIDIQQAIKVKKENQSQQQQPPEFVTAKIIPLIQKDIRELQQEISKKKNDARINSVVEDENVEREDDSSVSHLLSSHQQGVDTSSSRPSISPQQIEEEKKCHEYAFNSRTNKPFVVKVSQNDIDECIKLFEQNLIGAQAAANNGNERAKTGVPFIQKDITELQGLLVKIQNKGKIVATLDSEQFDISSGPSTYYGDEFMVEDALPEIIREENLVLNDEEKLEGRFIWSTMHHLKELIHQIKVKQEQGETRWRW